jgi:hypothetical protein
VSSRDEPAKGAGAADAAEELPLDFATFVLSLSHGGMMHLGDAPEPGGATSAPDLALARQTIDILALLEEKTRGNLTGDEERILSVALSDLKQRFIEVSQAT